MARLSIECNTPDVTGGTPGLYEIGLFCDWIDHFYGFWGEVVAFTSADYVSPRSRYPRT